MSHPSVSSATLKIDLAGLAACRSLAHRSGQQIAAIGVVHPLRDGETLFIEGDVANDVYQVLSGTLILYKALPDGRRQITGFLTRDQMLGLSSGDKYLYSADASGPVSLRRYPRAWFERLIDEVPGLARRLLAATRDELQTAQDQMLLLGRKTADERIASFLVMLADRSDARMASIEVPMNRSGIADYLGLTIETVSRTLGKMKHAGVIDLPSPTKVELRDRARLATLAAGAASVH